MTDGQETRPRNRQGAGPHLQGGAGQAAGIEAKAAASSVEEADALSALGNGAAPAGGAKAEATAKAKAAEPEAAAPSEPAAPKDGDSPQPAPQPAAPAKQRPTRDSLAGERAPGAGAGGRRRVVIDSQASRRQQGGPPPQPPRRQRRGRRRRGTYDEVAAATPAPRPTAPDTIRINSGSTVTFPLFVWGSARVATPPQINVIGTLIFMIAITGMFANILIQNRRAKRGYV